MQRQRQSPEPEVGVMEDANRVHGQMRVAVPVGPETPDIKSVHDRNEMLLTRSRPTTAVLPTLVPLLTLSRFRNWAFWLNRTAFVLYICD